MAILKLHDRNNPTQLKLVASDDISVVSTLNPIGSCIVQKGGIAIYVDESPEIIAAYLEEK